MPLNKNDFLENVELSAFLERVVGLVDFQGIKPTRVNERSILGDTLLHFAARWGDEKAGKILLDAGVDQNVAGEHGYTPLHNAVEQKHFLFAKLLLARGASKEVKNNDGLTPVDLARLSDEPKFKEVFS